ncbi:MAG: galactokinase [Actinomycetota bacterium]|jgi:galactokinase|nr:galactokinase [Actinomycetota bacterium]
MAVTDLPDVTQQSDAEPELRLTAYLYEQVFGHKATLVTSAPGALTLFGQPGDRYALAIPLKWGATVAAAPRDDDMVDLRSGSQAGKELTRPLTELDDLPRWAQRPLAVVDSVARAGHALGGMSLLVGTALPEGAGMQSDVGLTSVVASALDGLFGVDLTVGQRAALGDLPAQLASLTCPDDTAVLVDTWQMTTEPVPFDLVAAELRLMIIDLGEIVGSQPAGIPDLALTAVEELRRGGVAGLGPLFTVATSLAGDEAARAVADAACAAGALGAGTLPGGCLMAVVPVERLSPVRAAATAAWPGGRVPKFLTAVSSRGGRARRQS